ncbi:MAG: N-acetylmuramoyl-L-alanine amidase [Ignavibacteriaceae bacterium]|nr:N-acetylmuramoyl-L-alanine amidase [Ignavibacteriaceae bacterium]
MNFRSPKTFLFAVVILLPVLIAASFPLQQSEGNFLRLKFGSKEYDVKYYNKRGSIYISLDDLVKKQGLKVDRTGGKYRIFFANRQISFVPNNPFVVIDTPKEKKKKSYQMPLSSQISGGELFVPVAYAKSFLSSAAETKLTYEFGAKPVAPPMEEKAEAPPVKTFPLSYRIDEKANGTLLRIFADKNIPDFESSLKDNNLRLKINPSGFSAGAPPKGKGMISSVSSSSFGSRGEIVISLAPDFTSYDIIRQSPKSILVTVYNKNLTESKTPSSKKEKWNFNTIVIDAGHGGKDYGAIGPNNTIEKNINLAVALKLGALMKSKMPDVKVVYTRSTDKFIELYKRGKIANENDGKLFLSIHCNSVANRSSAPNGYEIYLLRPGRTKEAIAIAEIENSVIKYEEDKDRYKNLTDENFILVSMAHSAYLRYSEKFAEILDRSFKQRVDVTSRGVKQAGFYVLVGASMPSVLIELGYVTNAKDASYMRSENGQRQYAESIFEAVKTYRKYYEEIIKQE